MKIAHIAPPWFSIPPKNYGGTEIVLYNLIEEQVAQGHDVTLLAPGDARTSARLVSFFPQSLIDSGIPWQAHLKAFYHLYKAVEYVKDHAFDIVHTHLSSAADMYLFPLTLQLAAPLVVTLHSRFPFDRVQSWIGDADQYYMQWATSVPMVAISESARAEVPHKLNFVGVVHHGLSMEVFRPTVEQPEDFFVWLGRIIPDKGTHLAIQAARQAGVRLIIAGNVDQHLPEAVAYFEQQIAPQVDGQQISYVGPVNMQQKIDLLSRARGMLNPLQWEEPFGMVMLEAMALGCPVIVFARGAAPEIVAHRVSGFLVQNVDEMVQYIARIDELDRHIVRAYVEQNFSVRTMVEKYTSIYKRVSASKLLEASIPALSVQATVPLLSAASAPTLPNTLLKIDAPVRDVHPASHLAEVTAEAEPMP